MDELISNNNRRQEAIEVGIDKINQNHEEIMKDMKNAIGGIKDEMEENNKKWDDKYEELKRRIDEQENKGAKSREEKNSTETNTTRIE